VPYQKKINFQDAFIIPILQMEKWSHQEVKSLAQSHTANECGLSLDPD
jgi:hypothetical protein